MLDLLDPTLLHPLLSMSGLDDGGRPAPEPEDVKAGGVALMIWLGMAAAVALLSWSLVRELRKTNKARDAGVFGDGPATRSQQPGVPSAQAHADEAGGPDRPVTDDPDPK